MKLKFASGLQGLDFTSCNVWSIKTNLIATQGQIPFFTRGLGTH